jgi:hypothetical protein
MAACTLTLFNPRILARLIYEAPERSGLTIKDAAQRMGGVSPNYLARQINPDDEAAKLGVEDFVFLSSVTDLEALDYIERALGRVACPVMPGMDTVALAHLVAKSTREFGEMLADLAISLEDGVVTASEKEHCLTEIHHVLASLAALKSGLESI